MTPINMDLQELIRNVYSDTRTENDLERVSEAQRRAQTLSDVGDQLVGHFVSQARESGASWSQIGEAIGVTKQAAQQRDSLRLYQRFTDRARQALVNSMDIAREHSAAFITPEHLLHGTIAIEEGLAAKVVAHLSGSLDAVRTELITIFPRDAQSPPNRLTYSELGRRAIDETTKSALKLNHNYVGTEHVLLGIIAAGGPTTELLAKHGVTEKTAEENILPLLDAILSAKKAIADE